MGLSYSPAVVTIAMYFEKRRALANGIAVAGSGVGNFIIPLAIRYLIDHYNLQGALMIYGSIGFHVCICGAIMRPAEFYTKSRTKVESKDEEGANSIGSEKGDESQAVKDINQPAISMDPDAGDLEDEQVQEMTTAISKDSLSHRLTTSQSNNSINSEQNSSDEYYDDEQYENFHRLRQRKQSAFYGLSEVSAASVQSIPDYVSQLDLDKSTEKRVHSTKSCFSHVYSRLCTLPAGANTSRKPMFDWSLLRNPVFHVYYWSVLFSSCGYPSVFIMLPKFATESEFTKTQATWLVSIVGISDLVGRIAFGFFSDFNVIEKKYGFMGSMLLSGVTCAIFPFVRSFVGLAVCCSVFGLLGGSYIALTAVILVEALGVDKLPNAFGLSVLGQGIAMLISFPFIGKYKITIKCIHDYFLLGISLLHLLPNIALQRLRTSISSFQAFSETELVTGVIPFYFCAIVMVIGSICILFEPLATRKVAEKQRSGFSCFKRASRNKKVVLEVVSQV